jgi:preprotein translocase subunit SecE
MARAGRQQRRAARRAQKDGDETQAGKQQQAKQQPKQQPKGASRSRARQAQVRPGATPPKQQTGRRESAPRARFVRESWGELKKVEWPGRGQVMQGTVVVLIACAIVGAYLWVADLAFRNLVERVLI